MNAEQKQRAAELLAAWRATAYALHADRMAALLQDLIDAPEAVPVAWRYEDAFGTYFTEDYSEISNIPGVLSFTALFAAPPHQSEHHLEMVNTPAPSVPDGWRIVPYTPTVQMLERAAYAVNNRPQPSKYEPSATPAIIFWTAMLNYAPEAVFINSCSKPPKLSDERIKELSDIHMNMYGFDDVAFARAIEREILGGDA